MSSGPSSLQWPDPHALLVPISGAIQPLLVSGIEVAFLLVPIVMAFYVLVGPLEFPQRSASQNEKWRRRRAARRRIDGRNG